MSIYVIVTTIWTYWLSLIILVGYRSVVKLYTIAVIYSTPAVGCTNHSLSITFFFFKVAGPYGHIFPRNSFL